MEFSEYTEEELIGKPHNLIRHEWMPKAVFKLLWKRLKEQDEIFAFVVNKSKNGNFYWVLANVTVSIDNRGRVLGYYSVRRKPTSEAIAIMKPLYQKMIEIEKSKGQDASLKYLTDLLAEKGVGYDEFIGQLSE